MRELRLFAKGEILDFKKGDPPFDRRHKNSEQGSSPIGLQGIGWRCGQQIARMADMRGRYLTTPGRISPGWGDPH